MANAKRGLIEIELDGDVHELRYPTGAMKALQERMKVKTPADVWESMGRWSMDDWSFAIRLGLNKGSLEDATPDEVDDMVVGTETMYYQAVLMDAATTAADGRDGLSDRLKKVISKKFDEALGSADEDTAAAKNPQ